jgi:hypothetical protein
MHVKAGAEVARECIINTKFDVNNSTETAPNQAVFSAVFMCIFT